MKYVVLARPSSLIITDMKRMVSRLMLEPTPVISLEELNNFDPKDVGAIVVSTALSSVVKEKYWVVLKRVIQLFPGKPVILSSFATVHSTRLIAKSHLEAESINRELVSLNEVRKHGFSPERHILILTQKELADPESSQKISLTVSDLIFAPNPSR